MSPALIVGAVLATLAGGMALLWQNAENALDREQKARVTAELQRDQWHAHVITLENAIAKRNAIIARIGGLSESRLRLCVQRGPQDGCCRPEPAECKP